MTPGDVADLLKILRSIDVSLTVIVVVLWLLLLFKNMGGKER